MHYLWESNPEPTDYYTSMITTGPTNYFLMIISELNGTLQEKFSQLRHIDNLYIFFTALCEWPQKNFNISISISSFVSNEKTQIYIIQYVQNLPTIKIIYFFL